MKVIAVGDQHFQTSNVPDVTQFVIKLTELVINEKPDLIVLLGDLLHTHERLHVMCLNMAVDFVRKMSELAPVVILVGNHDMINNSQFLTDGHWLNCLKYIPNVEVADKVIHKKIKDVHMVFCPYVPNGRFQEALNSNEEDWDFCDIIFCHQEFYNCKMGAITSVDGDRWPQDFPEIISGHIHSKQRPQSNIYYCGSSIQVAYGESEDNIIPILELGGSGKYKLREVDLNLSKKKIVYKDISEADDFKVEDVKKDQVKLSLSGSYDEFKAFKKSKKCKDIEKTGTKVVFKAKKIAIKEIQELRNKNISELIQETDFGTILNSLVNNETNSFLVQAYELVVNNKEISEKDIVYL